MKEITGNTRTINEIYHANKIKRLEQQRDELLAALDKLANCNLKDFTVRKIAADAIAKAVNP